MEKLKKLLDAGTDKILAIALCWNKLTFAEKVEISKENNNLSIFKKPSADQQIVAARHFLGNKVLFFEHYVCGKMQSGVITPENWLSTIKWATVKKRTFKEVLSVWLSLPEGNIGKTTVWQFLKKKATTWKDKFLIWEIAPLEEREQTWEKLKKRLSLVDCEEIVKKLLPGSPEEIEISNLRKKKEKKARK